MRDLSGPAAFDQLQAQLARSAAGMARGKSYRRKAIEEALPPPAVEPDDSPGEVPPPGSG
ncbi:hypothetical protein GCM10009646_68490 [Streptomyces aureus]